MKTVHGCSTAGYKPEGRTLWRNRIGRTGPFPMEALALIGDLGLNVLEEEDVARCKEIFTMYDEDNDGKLTYGELLTVLRCCGRNPTVAEFKELVQVVDERLVRPALAHTVVRPLSPPNRLGLARARSL